MIFSKITYAWVTGGNSLTYGQIYANRIRQLCAERNVSVNHLAEMSGLRQSTLQNIICGRSSNPTTRTLHKIALAFSMTLSEFLDFEELNQYEFDKDDE